MQDSQTVRMELKYCECCGGLLLRPAGTGAIYCAGCAARVRELAPPRMPKRRGRPPKTTLPQVEASALESSFTGEIQAVSATQASPKRPVAAVRIATCEDRRMA